MMTVSLKVNGEACSATVEPRTHLADFLRQQAGLTGTHLGCEQGVCGACTVLIDDQPMRSCIAYAVSCGGSSVQTIEGFDDDALMADLREAFSVHHGLQCGFCTPGMLITARDIILRYGDADEATIRRELSGNICRCTGYMGIVAAIRAVASGRRAASAMPAQVLVVSAAPIALSPTVAVKSAVPPKAAMAGISGPVLTQSIDIDASPEQVWAVLADTARVAGCLPGAVVESIEGEQARGYLAVKFGPIRARFSGEATIERDEAARTGRIAGQGRDAKGGSSARGEVTYSLHPLQDGRHTGIDLTIQYQLTGALAQFGRSELVADFAGRMVQSFADNLSAMLRGGEVTAVGAEINLFTMLAGLLKARWRRLFGKG